jgi:NAD(P)-dependent dehydrogenase (short-subunit alcohol dehydrogenase family)
MNEVALVTGAGGALGAEVARVLSRRGLKIALADSERGESRMRELAKELGGAAVVVGDIGKADAWAGVIARIERELGAPPSQAALVAGGYLGGKPLHAQGDSAALAGMLGANVDTVYETLRAILPTMVARKKGSVVVIGSRAAVQPWTSAGSAAYAASKAAVVALAQAVAAEVLPHGVRVNAVMPSTMDTPANRAAMPSVDPAAWVTLQSAAGVVAFLLGDESRDVSGAAVPLYGRA